MSKEYRYRTFIRWGQYVIPMFLGLLILLYVWFLGPTAWRISSHLTIFTRWLFFVPILIALVGGGLDWYLYFRLAGIVVSVGEDAVIYKYRGGEKRFSFESLHLESSSIPYTGGWLKLISGKEVIRLTVVVEDIGEFVQGLKAALDSRGFSSHYDSQKLFGFLKTAVAADQSWGRAYVVFGKLFLIILVVGITLVNGYVFETTGSGSFFIMIWGFFSLFWALGAYVIAEIILMRKIAKQSVESAFSFPPRDLAYEKQVYNKAITWGGWLYFFISLLVLLGAIWIKAMFSLP